LLTACVKFYRDVLMMENFAIMNYCGFSKILKKHDKVGTSLESLTVA
jgi:SPX domain protein involved in polyphosphate accumulation